MQSHSRRSRQTAFGINNIGTTKSRFHLTKRKMKLKSLISLTLASSILALSIPQRANSNPAILAPAALCAGTAGVGCVLIVVGGVGLATTYLWKRNSDNMGAYANKDGQLMSGMWDTEEENHHAVWGENRKEVISRCTKMAKKYKWKLKAVTPGNTSATCIFEGKQTSFSGDDN
jgi:hypothetical protein